MIPVSQTCPEAVIPAVPDTERLRLSLDCPVTLCGVNWTGETPLVLDRGAVPWPGGIQYDRDGPPRDPEELYDHDGDSGTPMINRGTAHEPRNVALYQFQDSYTIPEDDPATADVNERDDYISLVEQDVRFAQYTVAALVDIIGIIRTGRDGEALNALAAGANLVGSEINDILRDRKEGAPVAAFSATRPLTTINPVAQIIAARGVSHDLRGAADEDVTDIDTLLAELARYEVRAMEALMAITDRLTEARGEVTRLRADITTQEGLVTSKRGEITTANTELGTLRRELADLFGDSPAINDLLIQRLNIDLYLQGHPDSPNPPAAFCSSMSTCTALLANIDQQIATMRAALETVRTDKRAEITDKRADIQSLRDDLDLLSAEVIRRGGVAQENDRLITDLEAADSDIQYWLRLIAAAESDAAAQQTADKAALDALPDDIESTKAAAIRTALEGIVNDPAFANPATARFARDGNLADLTAAGAAVFARNPSAAADSPPALYADYGMWLEGSDAVPVLRTRMGLAGTDAEAAGTGELTSTDNGLATSATYSGTARGLSARTATSGGDSTTASGHFTADVSLSATFGASPTLGGTVRNFRAEAGQGGAHVGPWSIDLPATGPRAGTGDIRNAPFGNVGADGNPTAGGWSAYAYGLDGARPTGVYGGFQADFADGAAIGQFDAR